MPIIKKNFILLEPYRGFAPLYDQTMGLKSFLHTRKAFESIVRRYGIDFLSAADIGCGTGLFACYLSKRWNIFVFGVDRSPEMLRVAARKCRKSKICFLLQDIRTLRLPNKVDLITANFDTLNHLLNASDLKLAFRRIWENLHHGGHFIFDLVTPVQGFRGGPFTKFLKGKRCGVMQHIQWNPWRRLFTSLIVRRCRSNFWTAVELHMERAYDPTKVGRWLRASGFFIRGVLDAASLMMASRSSLRVIFVTKKDDHVS